MKALIEEINNKLKNILNELRNEKEEMETSLDSVQNKIDEKIEEAKGYKLSVDGYQEEVRRLEGEISDLEADYQDLKERFANKDLNVVLETANKEINAKIVERQKEITKQRDRINEYTEKARMIKDLLVNLKKDKDTKKEKLDNLNKCLNYYEKELEKIMSFADENPDNLNAVIEEPTLDAQEDKEEIEDTFEYNDEPITFDNEVFDAIESIEKEDNNEAVEDVKIDSPKEDNEQELKQENEDNNYNSLFDEFKVTDNDYNDLVDIKDDKENTEESNKEDNISNLFANESNEEKIDFASLNNSINEEYANIFGNSDDINIEDDVKDNNEIKEDTTDFSDIFTDDILTSFKPEEEKVENNDVDNFFKNNNLDFNLFNKEEQEKLINNYDLISYTKTLDILRKNNIKLDYLYNSANIFMISHDELESIINKLLLAGQSTQNISYVLNTLSMINSYDLQTVIDSYGESIKDANITDLIIKAKHLKELNGGN